MDRLAGTAVDFNINLGVPDANHCRMVVWFAAIAKLTDAFAADSSQKAETAVRTGFVLSLALRNASGFFE
jgi:hypothetical protein